MINSLDIMSKLSLSLNNRMRDISEIIDVLADITDMDKDILDLAPRSIVGLNAKDQAILERILNGIAEHTYVFPNGVTAAYTINRSQGLSLINATTGSVVLQNDEGRVMFNGFAEGVDTFGDFVENLANTYTQSTVVQRAINLANKGELTTANFMSAMADLNSKANSSVSAVISNIADAIQGADPSGQATALLLTLRTMWKGVNTATANDANNIITFNDTEYTVSTSILLPFSVIATVASTVLGLLTSLVSPVFGALVGAVGASVGQLVNVINDNSSTEYKFVDPSSRDNNCFATPILQKTVQLSCLPAEYASKLDLCGYLKLVNGISTVYLWKDKGGRCNIEMFANADCDVAVNDSTSDLLETQIFNAAAIVSKAVTLNVPSISAVTNNIRIWLQNQVLPGGSSSPCERLQSLYNPGALFNKVSARYMTTTAMFILILWALLGKNGASYQEITELDWQDSRARQDYDLILVSFMGYLSKLGTDFINNPFGNNLRDAAAALINNVIPALRILFNQLSEPLLTQLFNLFPLATDSYDDSVDTRGEGYAYVTSYSIANKANAYVYPPKSTVSIWVRVALSLAVFVTVAVSSAVLATKIKRKIQYKAFKKRQELTAMTKAMAETGNYNDWINTQKAAKRYNRFLGKLSGTSFDYNNQWVSDVAAASVNSGLLSSLVKSIDGEACLSVADAVARKLSSDGNTISTGIADAISATSGVVSDVKSNTIRIENVLKQIKDLVGQVSNLIKTNSYTN